MAEPVVYGPAYSTYVRTVRMALREKGVPCRLEEVDVLTGATKGEAHLARHPFGKVPAFEHDGFVLYETSAVARYVDEAFDGPALQPADAKRRARMAQIVAIVDAYAYPAMITGIMVPRVVLPMVGAPTDEAQIEAAKPRARTALDVLEAFAGELDARRPTLADLHLLPVLHYFGMTPEGREMMAGSTRLNAWYAAMQARPAVAETEPKLG